VDANILVAAYLRDSTIRRIVTLAGLHLLVPDYIFEEFEKHRPELALRTGLGEEEAARLLERLRRHLMVVPSELASEKLAEAKAIMKHIDERDAAYVATALSVACDGTWSDDPHLKEQRAVRCLTTRELLDALRSDGVRF